MSREIVTRRAIQYTVTFGVALTTGFLMSLAGPTLGELSPLYIPTPAVYAGMFLMGLASVWTWSSIRELLPGFLAATAVMVASYSLINGWALAAIGLTMDIISGQILLHLFGYVAFVVLLGGAGVLVGGLLFRGG